MVEPTSSINVATLPRGFQFPSIDFQVSAADCRRYGKAVEAAGEGPALALAAFALRRLLTAIELPAGSLHASQDVEFLAPASLEAPLTMRARLAQRSERAGMVAAVIEFDVEDAGGLLLRGRSTVLVPQAGE